MSFEARYHGACGLCDEKITPGQTVKHDEAGCVIHDTCPAPTDDDTPRRNERKCLDCNMIHAGGVRLVTASDRRFTTGIGPSGSRFWMTVVVYTTTQDMHRAALRHRPTNDAAAIAESGGCFQAANSGHPNYLGIMRLTQEFLTPAAVVHEAVHAALVYVQKAKDVNRLHLDAWSSGARTIDNEESLAYAIHGIACALLSELDLVTNEPPS